LVSFINTDLFLAAELEGDGGAPVPAGAHDISGDDPGPLPEIDFDDGREFSVCLLNWCSDPNCR